MDERLRRGEREFPSDLAGQVAWVNSRLRSGQQITRPEVLAPTETVIAVLATLGDPLGRELASTIPSHFYELIASGPLQRTVASGQLRYYRAFGFYRLPGPAGDRWSQFLVSLSRLEPQLTVLFVNACMRAARELLPDSAAVQGQTIGRMIQASENFALPWRSGERVEQAIRILERIHQRAVDSGFHNHFRSSYTRLVVGLMDEYGYASEDNTNLRRWYIDYGNYVLAPIGQRPGMTRNKARERVRLTTLKHFRAVLGLPDSVPKPNPDDRSRLYQRAWEAGDPEAAEPYAMELSRQEEVIPIKVRLDAARIRGDDPILIEGMEYYYTHKGADHRLFARRTGRDRIWSNENLAMVAGAPGPLKIEKIQVRVFSGGIAYLRAELSSGPDAGLYKEPEYLLKSITGSGWARQLLSQEVFTQLNLTVDWDGVMVKLDGPRTDWSGTQTFKPGHEYPNPPWSYERFLQKPINRRHDHPLAYVSAHQFGRKLGHVSATQRDDGWKVSTAYVEPAHRRRGIGQGLYEEIADYTCGLNGRPLYTGPYRSELATALWEKLRRQGVARRRGGMRSQVSGRRIGTRHEYEIPCPRSRNPSPDERLQRLRQQAGTSMEASLAYLAEALRTDELEPDHVRWAAYFGSPSARAALTELRVIPRGMSYQDDSPVELNWDYLPEVYDANGDLLWWASPFNPYPGGASDLWIQTPTQNAYGRGLRLRWIVDEALHYVRTGGFAADTLNVLGYLRGWPQDYERIATAYWDVDLYARLWGSGQLNFRRVAGNESLINPIMLDRAMVEAAVGYCDEQLTHDWLLP